ncbi:MAG: hypothetical protein V3T70_06130 [Phycisphaerae bacterium]
MSAIRPVSMFNAFDADGAAASRASSSARTLAAAEQGTADVGSAETVAELSERLGELVGQVLLAPLIKQGQEGPFRSEYFDGGRAEKAFRSQLAMELSSRIGRISADSFAGELTKATARRMGLSAA